VEKIVGTEVDLVVLNRTPATLVWTVLRTGVALVVKNRLKYLGLMFSASDEANAWFDTSRRYYATFERSQSLAPEDADRLRRILTFLEEAVTEYESFRALSQEQYLNDRVIKRNIEHWIEHLIVSSVDIAEIILASERRQLPTIYRELMVELGSVVPFTKDNTCKHLAEWVQLRNMLAHEYLDYRWRQIESFLCETKPLFSVLIDRTREFMHTAEQISTRKKTES
jgi:uncharacterized protein YutE (UPF0331/DUF86 family)